MGVISVLRAPRNFTDSFTAPDGTTLESRGYTVGQFVTGTPAPTFTVQLNEAQFTGFAPYAHRPVAAGNVAVQAVFRAGTNPCLFPKFLSQDNYVYWRRDGVVRERVAGVNTETTIGGWGADGSGTVLRVEVFGDVFRYLKNGVLVAERTVTGFAASTLTGIGHASSDETAAWDDLLITY